MMTKQGWITRRKNGNDIPWNKGKKGVQVGWNKGIPMSLAARKKLSISNKGKLHNNALIEYYKTNSSWNKGIVGEKSHSYKDGRTLINAIERKNFAYYIRNKVLKRDDYTCQMCGSKDFLQVDHIQSWADYIELRFSMDNCRTLCMDCHYFITFGKPKPKDVIWGQFVTRRAS